MPRNNADFQAGAAKPWSPEYGDKIPTLYHGSSHDFKEGDIVSTQGLVNNIFKLDTGKFLAAHDSENLDALHDAGYAAKEHEGNPVVYASDSPEYASDYGDKLFEVEPVHASELIHIQPGEIGAQSGFRVKRRIR